MSQFARGACCAGRVDFEGRGGWAHPRRRVFPMKTIAALYLTAALVGAQAAFECGPAGSLIGGLQNCEGAVWNAFGSAYIDTAPTCGFPTEGNRFLHVEANGPVVLNQGGPFPRPLAGLESEVRLPIPTGATYIGFCWEFINAEGFGNVYLDGAEIAMCDAAGNVLVVFAYADTMSPLASCFGTQFNAPSILPEGANTVATPIPAAPQGAYLSIVVSNGNDNFAPSSILLDDLRFTPGPACTFGMTVSSPWPGSIAVDVVGGTPGNRCLAFFTLTSGNFPNGWFLGIDIPFPELMLELQTPVPPFAMTLDTLGAASFFAPAGIPSSLPVYAVALDMNPLTFLPVSTSPPVVHVTP